MPEGLTTWWDAYTIKYLIGQKYWATPTALQTAVKAYFTRWHDGRRNVLEAGVIPPGTSLKSIGQMTAQSLKSSGLSLDKLDQKELTDKIIAILELQLEDKQARQDEAAEAADKAVEHEKGIQRGLERARQMEATERALRDSQDSQEKDKEGKKVSLATSIGNQT
jgi:hypothetical protein